MKLEQSDKNFLFSETKLPDVFFTEYMSQANGDYIKVYLYIVFLSKYNKEVKINDVSKTLNIPFKTIQEAIAYWEEQEVLIKKNNGYIVVDLQEKELNKLYSPRLTSSPETALSNAKNQYRAIGGNQKYQLYHQDILSSMFQVADNFRCNVLVPCIEPYLPLDNPHYPVKL